MLMNDVVLSAENPRGLQERFEELWVNFKEIYLKINMCERKIIKKGSN